MKFILTAAALAFTLVAGSAMAAEPTKQQSKMSTCNAEAKGMKGDERKAKMKECLSAKKATQQDKMKTCNAEAKGMKGDARKAKMKECLSK
jgi:outer membrane murein-binding lipoprotein Lpp